MSPADPAGVKRKEETRGQEVRTGKCGDPRSEGPLGNKLQGSQATSFGSMKFFFEVIHPVARRNPERFR